MQFKQLKIIAACAAVLVPLCTAHADSWDDFVQDQIHRSVAAFPGECPCPYSVDQAGNRCGDKSAYLGPIEKYGYIPFCYPSDIKPMPGANMEPDAAKPADAPQKSKKYLSL